MKVVKTTLVTIIYIVSAIAVTIALFHALRLEYKNIIELQYEEYDSILERIAIYFFSIISNFFNLINLVICALFIGLWKGLFEHLFSNKNATYSNKNIENDANDLGWDANKGDDSMWDVDKYDESIDYASDEFDIPDDYDN